MSFDIMVLRNISRITLVSIPLEQGNVFRHNINLNAWRLKSLNPFGTGQCLSTEDMKIKLQQDQSQSLWNRAMSFDIVISQNQTS